MTYKYFKGSILDSNGKQLIVLLASNCTNKFRDMAGKNLVNILNSQARGMELSKRNAK